MLPTPDLSHLTSKDYEHVYEPAGHITPTSFLHADSILFSAPEDTFILLDALEAEVQVLKNDHPSVCLEIGYLTFIFWRLVDGFSVFYIDLALAVSLALLRRFLGPQYVRRLTSSLRRQRTNIFRVYLCTDINPHACICSLSTGVQNGVGLPSSSPSHFEYPFRSLLSLSIPVLLCHYISA